MKLPTINQHLKEYKKKIDNYESLITQIIDINLVNYQQ